MHKCLHLASRVDHVLVFHFGKNYAVFGHLKSKATCFLLAISACTGEDAPSIAVAATIHDR
jgi:hypothetical protein